MKASKTVIDITEKSMNENTDLVAKDRLEELEAIISKGITAFYAVGHALIEIREKRLFLKSKGGEFKTFEQYCEIKWGLARRTAYQYIAGTEVVDNVRTCAQIKYLPSCEGQTRYLAMLGPSQQIEAWQKITEAVPHGGPTVRQIKQIVDEMRGKTPSVCRRKPPLDDANPAPEQKSTNEHIKTPADQAVREPSTPHHPEPHPEEIAPPPGSQVTEEHVEKNEDKTLLPPTDATREPECEPETAPPATRHTAMECAAKAIHELKMININDPMLEEAYGRVRDHMDGILRYKAEKMQKK